jgi:4-hydroxy-3-polyprenylbenzoate decarboxylase
MENVRTGNQVNLLEFPTPKWHEFDGGPYIGTGCVVITKDPETGWVNYGTYRAQIHDEKTTGIDAAPHHHAKLMMRKYWAKGQSCPMAVAISVDPALFCASTSDLPWGRPEIELGGFIKGSPIEIMESELTGLPLPATAELIFEGEVPPMEVEQRKEGPFGEYTGYYAGGEKMAPVIRVKAIYFRTNPILHGEPPLKPPIDTWVIPPAVGINFLWDGLERGGLPGIRGVYALRVGGRFITVVSIKQQYGGHARLVGKMASALIQGMGRFIIVVDDDIDPSDPEGILWALASRCDPETQIEIERNCPSSTLDAMISPEKRAKGDLTNSRAVMIACKPFDWMDKFPRVNRASDELRAKVMEKWGSVLK